MKVFITCAVVSSVLFPLFAYAEGAHQFSGQLGGYSSKGDVFLSKDCRFKGSVAFGGGVPTGGLVNRIEGFISGGSVTFTRFLEGPHAGQSDQFSGTISGDGSQFVGSWGAFPYTAVVTPPLSPCTPG